MGMLDNFPLELTCPECGKKTEQKIGWLKGHDTFTFPCCGFTCSTEKFAADLASAEKMLDKFGRDLGDIGKKS